MKRGHRTPSCAGCGAELLPGAPQVVRKTGFDGGRVYSVSVCVDCFEHLDAADDPRVTVQRRAIVATTESIHEVVSEIVAAGRERAWVESELAKLPLRI